jgi:hypothetical protein
MLIITGTGRCGTSLLAQLCRELGYDKGIGGGWDKSINAGWESRECVEINDRINELGRQRRLAEALEGDLAAKIMAFKPRVVKDPRFVRHPGVMRVWATLRKDLRVVISHREVRAAVRSSREAFFSSIDYWRTATEGEQIARLNGDLLSAVQSLADNRVPFRFVYFPEILSDYAQVHDALSQFGELKWDRLKGSQKWAELCKPEMVHWT